MHKGMGQLNHLQVRGSTLMNSGTTSTYYGNCITSLFPLISQVRIITRTEKNLFKWLEDNLHPNSPLIWVLNTWYLFVIAWWRLYY